MEYPMKMGNTFSSLFFASTFNIAIFSYKEEKVNTIISFNPIQGGGAKTPSGIFFVKF